MELQLENFFPELNDLQKEYGCSSLMPIFGTGKVNNPKYCFMFMNPTSRNISSDPTWSGIRAPWLGTKNVWKLFQAVGLLSDELFIKTQKYAASEWDKRFSLELYEYLASKDAYLTNLAKCTQVDARHLPASVFQKYRENTLREINVINPQIVIAFGTQVSSVLLGKSVKVSSYVEEGETLFIEGKTFAVYPTYYPVGQGMRNFGKAVERILPLLAD